MRIATSNPEADTRTLDSEVEETVLIHGRYYQPWSLERDASFIPVDEVIGIFNCLRKQL